MTQTITYDFDNLVERRGTGCAKWGMYPDDVLPMWVADMDFRSPLAVLEALSTRVEHGVFGYTPPPADLSGLIIERLRNRYGWDVSPEALIYTPGVMVGVNLCARAFARDGGIIIQPPVYFPFYETPHLAGATRQEAPLKYVETDDGFTYEIDFDVLENSITDETKMLLFCSPHNPVGRVWRPDELERLAAVCVEHDLILCSDEIHSDLLMPGFTHTPSAMVSAAIRERTVTMIAPSKTYNVPGLSFSVAIIENPDLRARFVEAGLGLVMHEVRGTVYSYINMMGYTAATAAYRDGDDWLEQALDYIAANRDHAIRYLNDHLPEIKIARLEGTYLLWLDCRALGLPNPVGEWFLQNAKIAFSGGEPFGEEGTGFVRVNLATSRGRLDAALDQMREALDAR